MKNTELLRLRRGDMTSVEMQHRFLLDQALMLCECPVCLKPSSLVDASRQSLDEYDVAHCKTDYVCPHCGVRLQQVVPFIVLGARKWSWSRFLP
jgi:rubrerythrin